jgi:hypothetical protein
VATGDVLPYPGAMGADALSSRAARRARDALPLAAASLGVIAALYGVDYLPTNDGPQNAYAAFVRAHLHEAPFDRYYAATWPWTAWGWGVVLGILERALGWREAYRAAIAVAALAWVLGGAAIVRALPRERRALVWVAGAGALQWALYMGFFNWLLGTGLGLWAFGAGVRLGHEPRARPWIAPGALLLLASVCHPFGAQVGGFGLLVHVLLSTPRAPWPRRFVWLALVGLVPVVVTVGSVIGLSGEELSPELMGHHPYYAPWPERLQGFAWFNASGPWFRWAPPLVVAALGLGAGLSRARRAGPLDRTLLVLATSLTALALLTPRHGVVWLHFSARFVPVAVLFASLLLPLEQLRARWARGAAHAALAGVFVVGTAWAARYHVRLRAASAPWLAALGAPDRARGTLLPIVTQTTLDPRVPRADMEIPFARPHVNTGLVYAMDRAAASPYTFSMFPAVHVIQNLDAFPRAPGPVYFQDALDRVTDRAARAAELVRLASYGASFDEVLVQGPEDLIQVLLDRGYEPVHRSAGLLLARFRGCPTTLRLEGRRPDPLQATVVLGWEPAFRPVEIDEGWSPAALPAERSLPLAGCGPIRVHVALGYPELACAGEDAAGQLHAGGGGTILCRIGPRGQPPASLSASPPER